MLAIDANVIVRYLVGDDPRQATIARKLIDGRPVRVSRTVLLESEWVLRSGYGFDAAKVHTALADFLALPTVTVETPSIVKQALDAAALGMDFADALHLAACQDGMAFASFGRRLIARARKLRYAQVHAL
ncbi:MAG TPA: type II toxin-antitoxin system VapC family toxin [Pseudoxanthomonas sp.]